MQDLQNQLQSIGLDKHRYRVFDDFVTICAISLHNQGAFKCPHREEEYLKIINTYPKHDQEALSECFAKLVMLLDKKPADILGQLYMNMALGDPNKGQFFTPDPISQFMSKCVIGELDKLLENKPFVTLSEPACGAGGLILAYAQEMIRQGHNPADKLWVQAIDVSRVAALSCYTQLSLWNIPAQVIVGNSLSLEMKELWHTPAHVRYEWQSKLKLYEQAQKMRQIISSIEKKAEEKEKRDVLFPKPKIVNADEYPPKTKKDVAEAVQIGFDFG